VPTDEVNQKVTTQFLIEENMQDEKVIMTGEKQYKPSNTNPGIK
jgi:hypothetical protein